MLIIILIYISRSHVNTHAKVFFFMFGSPYKVYFNFKNKKIGYFEMCPLIFGSRIIYK